MPKKFSFLLLLILLGLGGFYLYNKFRVAPKVDVLKLPLYDLNGEPFDLNSLKGKKVILCFSASWCGNCIREMNAMKKIRDTELKDIEIIIVDDEPVETIIGFKERKQYPFTFLKLNKPFTSIGIHSIPVSYFYNAQLTLKEDKVGEIDWMDPSTREHYKQVMNQ